MAAADPQLAGKTMLLTSALAAEAKVPKSLIDAAPMDPDELRQAVTYYYRVRILGDLPSWTGH